MFLKSRFLSGILLSLTIAIQGCMTGGTAAIDPLQWQVAENEKLIYALHMNHIHATEPNAIYQLSLDLKDAPELGFEAFRDPAIYRLYFEKLENQLQDVDTQKIGLVRRETTIERWQDRFLSTFYQWRRADPNSKNTSERLIWMNHTVFDKTGMIYGNHVERNFHNAEQSFYEMPPVEPKVGASWEPSTQLMGANEGFVPTRSQRAGESRIVKIWRDEKGNRIMRTHTLVAEEIAGYGVVGEKDINDFLGRATAMVLKDYYLDRGQLKQMIINTYIFFQGSLGGNGLQSRRIIFKQAE